MAKVMMWRGKTEEEAKKLSMKEFQSLCNSRARRSLQRELTSTKKRLLHKMETDDKNIMTHCRDMIIVPSMLGKTIKIYNGKEYLPVIVTLEMLGHYLGEFAMSRKMVTHGAAGLGATRSSKAVSAK